VVAVTCFALCLSHAPSRRTSPAARPGTPATAGIDLTRAQTIDRLLTQAEVDVANKQDATALKRYAQVSLLIRDVTALTQSGLARFHGGQCREHGLGGRS